MSICAVVSLLILHSTSAFKLPSRGNINQFNIRATLESSDAKESVVTSDIASSLKQTISIKRDLNHDFDDIPSPIFNDKPPLLFLPGLDGVGGYSATSIGKLNLGFDVWKMAIKADDRSTFMEIAATVIKALDTFDKPVVLVGESFGGLLAAYIALRVKREKIAKLVLINPATSFDRTAWPLLVPLISNTGIAFPFVGIATLMTIVPDLAQMQRYSERILSTINSTETAVNVVTSLLKAGQAFTEILPSETLNWRVSKWFGPGTSIMEGKYSQIKPPTLILIGKNDRLLPSQLEGKRLLKEMTGSERVDVKEFECGHALLEDGFIDFADEILKSSIFQEPSNPLDCPMPTRKDMEDVERNFGPFLNAMSPVFLSRGKDKLLRRGVENIPTGLEGRPVLLVGNHQLYGADCAQIIREFLNKKSTLVRGLAHPMVFNDKGSNPFMAETLKKYGAVEVTPGHIFELLKRNETVMLFPGGAREALHGKGEEYKLFWPEKVDFVRMAGLFDAIIVPFSSIGIAESVNIFFDKTDLAKVPFIGEPLLRFSSQLPSARPGDLETTVPPLFIPKAPERNYFLFGQPFDTRDVNIYNKKQCKVLYQDVRASVEDGLETLFKFRESDPYKEFIPRTVYELTSGGKQAPTAPLNLKE